MSVLPSSAYEIPLPKMVQVDQLFPDERVGRIDEVLAARLEAAGARTLIPKGASVALLVGSRGIDQLAQVVRALVSRLREMGAEPFIVPSMGSHGGGRAEEQQRILEDYGVTEAYVGAPIRSSMETVVVGRTEGGVQVHIDKLASQADAIVPVARVKTHTDFDAPIESGLCKMLAIGLGKHNGCARLHMEGFDSFHTLIPQAAAIILETRYIPFGVALVENAHEHLHTIQVVRGSAFLEEEPALLALSKSLMPGLQFERIDVLVVEQIGKDLTGAGMDPNITGRTARGRIPGFRGPEVGRIVVLGLSAGTHNNATGCGIADFITRRAYEQIDLAATYTNCIASGNPEAGRTPVIMPSEEEAIRAAIHTCAGIDVRSARVVRIQDTLHLTRIQVSENMLPLCRDASRFSVPEGA